jgi:hypothetical protein
MIGDARSTSSPWPVGIVTAMTVGLVFRNRFISSARRVQVVMAQSIAS